MYSTSIKVHYRVGSLEIFLFVLYIKTVVHYRVGSLEIIPSPSIMSTSVHYRVGSLEKIDYIEFVDYASSLPCR